MNVIFLVFEGIGFSFYHYITYFTSLILAFCDSMCCVFPECRRGRYFLKKILGLFLAFNVASSISWILKNCFQVLRDFLKSFLWIVLNCFYCKLRCMLRLIRCNVFGGFVVLLKKETLIYYCCWVSSLVEGYVQFLSVSFSEVFICLV